MKNTEEKSFVRKVPLLITLLAGAVVMGFVFLVNMIGSNIQITPLSERQTSAAEMDAGENSALSMVESELSSTEDTLSEEPSLNLEESPEVSPEESLEESSEEEWKELTFTEVTPEYFSDALFIGDSRVDGLCANAPFPGADYYYKTSLTIFEMMDGSTEECEVGGYSDLRSILQNKQYGKVYICLGINDVLDPTDEWISTYWDAVQEIRAYQPHALIFVQGVMYVSASRMAAEPYFDSQMLNGRNQMLSEFANGRDIFYLDISQVYNDGGDNLPEEYTGDGVHLKPQYYGPWHDMFMACGIVTETEKTEVIGEAKETDGTE